MNQLSYLTSIVYGILLIFGGLMGFIKSHSNMSLITGLFSGILVFLALNISPKKPKESYLLVAAISLILTAFFALKYSASHAFVPSGLMLIFSTTTFAIVALSWLKTKGKQ